MNEVLKEAARLVADTAIVAEAELSKRYSIQELMTVICITWVTSNFLAPVASVASPGEELEISIFRGHVLLGGNKMNSVLAPFPVVGPSPVPSSQSTLTEVEKVKDIAFEMTPFDI